MQNNTVNLKKVVAECSVCGSEITLVSPVDDLCRDCFEKEVFLSRLIEYLQTTDVKKLNIIQSCPIKGESEHPQKETVQRKRAYLEQMSNGKRYELVSVRTVFGRGKEKSDYVISNTAMSGKHATVINENGRFFIVDENSSNGTWINGERIDARKKYLLGKNDRVRFANENMIFIEE